MADEGKNREIFSPNGVGLGRPAKRSIKLGESRFMGVDFPFERGTPSVAQTCRLGLSLTKPREGAALSSEAPSQHRGTPYRSALQTPTSNLTERVFINFKPSESK